MVSGPWFFVYCAPMPHCGCILHHSSCWGVGSSLVLNGGSSWFIIGAWLFCWFCFKKHLTTCGSIACSYSPIIISIWSWLLIALPYYSHAFSITNQSVSCFVRTILKVTSCSQFRPATINSRQAFTSTGLHMQIEVNYSSTTSVYNHHFQWFQQRSMVY